MFGLLSGQRLQKFTKFLKKKKKYNQPIVIIEKILKILLLKTYPSEIYFSNTFVNWIRKTEVKNSTVVEFLAYT